MEMGGDQNSPDASGNNEAPWRASAGDAIPLSAGAGDGTTERAQSISA